MVAATVLVLGHCWCLWVRVDPSPGRKGEFVAISPAMVHKPGWGRPQWYYGKKYPRYNKEVEKLKIEAPSRAGLKELMQASSCHTGVYINGK